MISEIPAVPDLTDWVFHRDLLTTNPTSLSLERGRIVCKNPGFDGTEFEVDYLGPPPVYRDTWWNVVPAFAGFAIPA